MIEHTFSHLKGISEKAEKALWQAGVRDWNNFLEEPEIPLARQKRERLRAGLEESRHALSNRDHQFFSRLLPAREHWRLFGAFRDAVAYVDIETTGLSREMGKITTIALYDGRRIQCYVNGQNLRDFPRDIRHYDLLVTYNGKCFDIPFMAEYFGTSFPQSHIDLRYVLKSLGYTGGLKGCERQFGLARPGLDGVDGYFAVLLWQAHQSGRCPTALETLLAYNIEDVVNLEHLMHQAYNRKVQDLPFAPHLLLDVPEKPLLPYTPDAGLVEQLKLKLRGALG